MDRITWQIIVNLLLSGPNYIIFAIGLLACRRRWDRHPEISFLVICSLVSLTAGSVLANVGIPLGWKLGWNHGGQDEADLAASVVRAAVALPYALGFALLLYAALAGRDAPSPETVDHPPQ